MSNYNGQTFINEALYKRPALNRISVEIPTGDAEGQADEMYYFKLTNNLLLKLLVNWDDNKPALNITIISLITHQTVDTINISADAFEQENADFGDSIEELEFAADAVCDIIENFVEAFSLSTESENSDKPEDNK